MSSLAHLVQGLNPFQAEAALHTEGPLLVIAGAGAGKTRTAIHRLACLLARGVPAENLLCITFTNKAAREMRDRAAALVGGAAEQVTIGTFHAAAASLLRQSPGALATIGRTPDFGIADPDVQKGLIKEALAERNLDLKEFKPERFQYRIGRYKNELADPDSLLWRKPSHDLMDWPRVLSMIKETDRFLNRMTAEVWQRYEEKLRRNNLMDFDDLIGLLVQLLYRLPDLRARWQRRFSYLQVDEFQDTNIAQLQMVKLLAGDTQNVMAVGDDAQSIYSWRSADIRCILEFEREFRGARVVLLEQNYRSTASIIRAANQLIAHNTGQRPKRLFTDAEEGAPVTLYEAEHGEDEARFVAAQIQALVAAGRAWSDFAILYRTNLQSRLFEEQLRESQIPYHVVGGPRFYDRREVRDALSYLKLLANPRDSVALERILNVPKRSIGERAYARILAIGSEREVDLLSAMEAAVVEGAVTGPAAAGAQALATIFRSAEAALSAGQPIAQICERLIRESGMLSALEAEDREKGENRSDQVRSLLNAVWEFQGRRPGTTLGAWLEHLALADARDGEREGVMVRMQTIHSAKGLEFPVVFVVGMEEGIMPNQRALEENNLAEERRLCYVAMTRAREVLILTGARIRGDRGEFKATVPSRFLQEFQTIAAV